MLCAALEDLIRERLEREVNIKVNEVVKEKIKEAVNKEVNIAVSLNTKNILNALEEIHNQTPLNEIRKRYHLTDAEWSRLEKLALY